MAAFTKVALQSFLLTSAFIPQVCHAQFAAKRLHVHSGYFDAETGAPIKTKQGTWNVDATINPPKVDSSVSSSPHDIIITQLSQNGKMTAESRGYGYAKIVGGKATVYARSKAKSTAHAGANLLDIAISEVQAYSDGYYDVTAGGVRTYGTFLSFQNVANPAIVEPFRFVRSVVAINGQFATGYAAQYEGNGMWRMGRIGTEGIVVGAGTITYYGQVNFAVGDEAILAAESNIATQSSGTSFGLNTWTVDTIIY